MLTSHIRVAQLVSVILIIIGLVILIYRRIKYQPPLYKAGPLTWNKGESEIMRRLTKEDHHKKLIRFIVSTFSQSIYQYIAY